MTTVGHTIDVIIKDGEILIEDTVNAQIINFRIINKSDRASQFHIYGNGVDKSLEKELSAGESGMLQVQLPTGTYHIEVGEGRKRLLNVVVTDPDRMDL